MPAAPLTAASFLPAITSAIGVFGAIESARAQRKTIAAALAAEEETLAYSQNMKARQIEQLDRIMGDKLSASGLEAMKAEARLRAAAAETGTAGGTTLAAIQNAYMQENLRDAAIIQEARIQKESIKSEMLADLLQFRSGTEALVGQAASPQSVFMSALAGGLSGFQSGLGLLGESDRERALGVDIGVTYGQTS